MSISCSIIRAGQESHRIQIAHRDWGLLHEPLFNEGAHFMSVFGVYEKYTLSGGLPAGTRVKREQLPFLNAARCLLIAIERDENLLSYDYTYSFASNKKVRHSGGQSGFLVRGSSAFIQTRPHGFCYLKLLQRDLYDNVRVAEIIDMRVKGSIETDKLGTLEVHRKKAKMSWPEVLPPLINFLRARPREEVMIEHYDRASQAPV